MKAASGISTKRTSASNGGVAAVLDLDSPRIGRFTAEDQAGLEALVRALEGVVDFSA